MGLHNTTHALTDKHQIHILYSTKKETNKYVSSTGCSNGSFEFRDLSGDISINPWFPLDALFQWSLWQNKNYYEECES